MSIADRIIIDGVRHVAALVKSRANNIGGVISIQTGVPDYTQPQNWHPPKLDKIPQLFLTVIDDAHHLPEIPSFVKLNHPAEMHHISEAIDFASKVSPRKNLLIHCHAGIFRSTAIALAIIAHEYGPRKETETLQKLTLIRPRAVPSLPLVKLADDFLKRDGKLLDAVMNEPRIARELADLEQFWCESGLIRGVLRPPLPPSVFVRSEGDTYGPARPNPLTYGRVREASPLPKS
jgi:predicted protein tyrosine phosphatase